MRKTPRRRLDGDVTEIEWKWLTAAPDANLFLPFGVPAAHARRLNLTEEQWNERLRDLWAEHEADIRQLWRREGAPVALPWGHPLLSGDGAHFECVGWKRQGRPERCWRCQLAIRGEKVPPMPDEFDPRYVLRMNYGTVEHDQWSARRHAWLRHGDPHVST